MPPGYYYKGTIITIFAPADRLEYLLLLNPEDRPESLIFLPLQNLESGGEWLRRKLQ